MNRLSNSSLNGQGERDYCESWISAPRLKVNGPKESVAKPGIEINLVSKPLYSLLGDESWDLNLPNH